MLKDVAAAHRDSLMEWARHYRNDETPGCEEVAFLMERAARQLSAVLGEAPAPSEVSSAPLRDEEPLAAG